MRINIHWFYYIARFILRVAFFTLTDWRINGKENVPTTGPVLVVANHLNLIDPPLLSVSLVRKTVFMAKEELFKARFTGHFIRSFGAFPVRRNQADTSAIKQALKTLSDGMALVIFPEASRSPNAQLQPAYPGVALIALRSGVPIVPVGITGTEKMKGKLWPFRRLRVAVNIGQPFRLSSNGKPTREGLEACTGMIMEHIAGQLPEEFRGHYSVHKEPNAARN